MCDHEYFTATVFGTYGAITVYDNAEIPWHAKLGVFLTCVECKATQIRPLEITPDWVSADIPDWGPELPADPTGVDCPERYEGIEP